MSDRAAVAERVQQLAEVTDSMEASLAYVERLIAWWELGAPVPEERPSEAESTREGEAPAAP